MRIRKYPDGTKYFKGKLDSDQGARDIIVFPNTYARQYSSPDWFIFLRRKGKSLIRIGCLWNHTKGGAKK